MDGSAARSAGPEPVGPSAGPGSVEATPAVGAEVERLRAEAAAARTARDMALQELLALQDTINRVAAVCDMAEWAADLEGSDGPVMVNVEDVRNALRPSG